MGQGTSTAENPGIKEDPEIVEDPEIEEDPEIGEHPEIRERTHWPRPSIFRAPAHMRFGGESNFEPKLVSIGPYYHGLENLQRMENLKLRCISEYLLNKEHHQNNPSYMSPSPTHSEAGIQHRQNQSIYKVSVEPATQEERVLSDVDLQPFKDSGIAARAYYKQQFDHTNDYFVRMLVIDSCFIIRTIVSLSQEVQESMAFLDVHIKDVRSDMLLMENQIPLFFIREVYKWIFASTNQPRIPPFETVLEPFICLDMPWRINHGAMMCSITAAHFLDLYWRCSLSPQMYMELFERELEDLVEQNREYISELVGRYDDELERDLSEPNRGFFSELVRRYLLELKRYLPEQERDLSKQYSRYLLELVKKISHELRREDLPLQRENRPEQQIQNTVEGLPTWAEIDLSDNAPTVIPNTTELQKMVGIEFKKFINKGHLDVIFFKGIMRMPRLKIDSRQITLLRNLIAFENCILPSMRIISCYMKLMGALIDSEKDVELLQKCGVIYNTLSSHEMAATFFNDIGKFCFIDYKAYLFSGLYKNVQEYYNSSWNRRWASLQQKYFSSPWAGISATAAVMLLIFSFVQALSTVMGHLHPKK